MTGKPKVSLIRNNDAGNGSWICFPAYGTDGESLRLTHAALLQGLIERSQGIA